MTAQNGTQESSDSPLPLTSLEGLTAAFARMMGDAGANQDEVEQADPPVPSASVESESRAVDPQRLVEAMLFVGRPDGSPLSPGEMASIMRGVTEDDIREFVQLLNIEYAANNCPYRILAVEGGFRLELEHGFRRLRNAIDGRMREVRLSTAAIEVLSIVAYHEPVPKTRLEELREKPCGAIVSNLVRRGLLRVERSSGPPRTVYYRTTERFLALFGLGSLDDLPRSEDVETN